MASFFKFTAKLTILRRGVPLGYIAALEQRLLTTEIALLEALSTFHDKTLITLSITEKKSLRKHDEARSKDARMEEWKRLPLEHISERQAWSSAKMQKLREEVAEEDVEMIARVTGDAQQDSAWLENSSIVQNQDDSAGNAFDQFESAGVAANMAVFGHGNGSGNVLDIDEEVAGTLHNQRHVSIHEGGDDMARYSLHVQPSGPFEQISNMIIPDSGWSNAEEEPRGVLRQVRRSDRTSNSKEWQNYF